MKANISRAKIVSEYENFDGYNVVTFNRETGKRISTYGNLDLHKAFSEALIRMKNDVLFLVLQYPEGMTRTEAWEAEKTYETALKYAATIDLRR